MGITIIPLRKQNMMRLLCDQMLLMSDFSDNWNNVVALTSNIVQIRTTYLSCKKRKKEKKNKTTIKEKTSHSIFQSMEACIQKYFYFISYLFTLFGT